MITFHVTALLLISSINSSDNGSFKATTHFAKQAIIKINLNCILNLTNFLLLCSLFDSSHSTDLN